MNDLNEMYLLICELSQIYFEIGTTMERGGR